MSSLPVTPQRSTTARVNATFIELLTARPAGTASPQNALPWRRRATQEYLSTLSATKAATAGRIIDYISYRYRIGEYTAQFTYAEIASHLGVCTKTIQRYLHDLIDHRLLAVVRAGRSALYSPTERNEAPIYTLLILCQQENVHPLSSLKKSVKSLKDTNQKFPSTQVPVSRSEQMAACEELKIQVIDLRKVPTFMLVRRLKKTFSAGWCVRDIVGALERTPEGEVYLTRGAGGMRSVLAWLHLRLNAWKTEDGSLLPSVTRTRYEQQVEARAQAIARQQQLAEELKKPVVVPAAGLEKMRLMREFLKVRARYGVVEAARLYPEQAELIKK